MPEFSDWFVVSMGVLCPVTGVLGVLAFAPSISTMKGWFKRGGQ